MKRTQVLATLALAFMLGVAVPATAFNTIVNAQAYAQETVAEPGSGNIWLARNAMQVAETDSATVTDAAHVSTAEELAAALNNSAVSTIILDNDLTEVGIKIVRTTPVTLDLNNHNIQARSTSDALWLAQGQLTIAGTGTIAAAYNSVTISGSADENAEEHSVLEIGSGVTLNSTNYYGISVVSSETNKAVSSGVVVKVNGTIKGGYGIGVNGNIQRATNRPQISIADAAKIETTNYEDSTPIYAAGTAEWHIGAATLSGKSGLGIKAGSFTFTNTKVSADGKEVTPSLSNNGIEGTSVVFQIEHNNSYAGNISLSINGGSYTSSNSNVFYEYGNDAASIKVLGGVFTAGTGKTIFGNESATHNVLISGGTFVGSNLSSLETFLAEGLIINDKGEVVIAPIEDSTITDRAGNVSITGKFAQSGLTVEAAALDQEGMWDDLFSEKQVAAYQLTVRTAESQAVTNLPSEMQVSIKVPENIAGIRSNIYAVSDDNSEATKINSVYKDGSLVFTTNALGSFAIVEEPETEPSTPGNSGSNPTQTTIKTENGDISISGNFAAGQYSVKAEASNRKVEAFGLAKYALYDINLFNAAGVKVNPDGAVTVSIKVPKEIDGAKSSIYYVDNNGKSEKLKSTYADGVISFVTTHFSLYAIVEDGGPSAGSIVSTPETGALAGHGIASAVSTMMPLLMGAGVMFALFGRKLIARRHAEAMAGVDCEIVADAKAIIAEVEAEPQIERFVATPMTAADEEEIKSHIFTSNN